MLKIGEFSKLSRISIRMLRHYNELGLLIPDETDVFSGYRYYSERQLVDAMRIVSLRDMGFGIAEIGDIVKNGVDDEMFDRYLSGKLSELSLQLEAVNSRMRLIETARERFRKDMAFMKYDVVLKTLPERYVASVRMTIPSYEHEIMLWDTLCKETDGYKMINADPCICSVVFYDGEYKEKNVEVEAQKTVVGSYKDTENVKFKTIAPVTFASATYKGGYEKINEVNIAVANWIKDNGYQLDGYAFNIYHVSPHETDDPNEFVTEVCYPVKKK